MFCKNKRLAIYIIIVFAFVTSFNLFAQTKVIINKITFEGIKTTNPKYLLSQITAKEGAEWNEEIKEKTKSELLKITKIVEEVEIIETLVSSEKVDLTIKILEKSAFILVPFFTYSNSRGLMPKAIFRYFNVGGYNKYLKSKMEFIPTESLNFNLRFEDPAVLNKSNMNYYIDGWFNTSAINYFANVNIIDNNLSNTTIKGIPPIGAFGNNGSQRWNKQLFYEFITNFQYKYVVPDLNFTFVPKFSINFKRVQEQVDSKNDFIEDEKVQQTIINPAFSFSTSFPVPGKNFSISPTFFTSYKHYYGKDTFSDAFKASKYGDYAAFYSEGIFNIGQILALPFIIPKIFATLTPAVTVSFTKFNAYAHHNYNDFIVLDYFDQNFEVYTYIRDAVDLTFSLDFDKSFNYRNSYHRFQVSTAYYQRVYGDWGVTKSVRDGYVDGTKDGRFDSITEYYPFYTRFNFQFAYWFNLNFLRTHNLKIRTRLFAKFNDILELSSYDNAESADDLSPGKIRGWAGLFMLLKYELPLFNVATQRFLTKEVSRPLKWEVYWDFYMNAGLAQNNEPEIRWYEKDDGTYKELVRYTIDRNNLHLYPALTLGTTIRVLPKFVPTQISLNVAGNIWQILRDKEISGKSILLEFSIDDAF